MKDKEQMRKILIQFESFRGFQRNKLNEFTMHIVLSREDAFRGRNRTFPQMSKTLHIFMPLIAKEVLSLIPKRIIADIFMHYCADEFE